MNLQRYSAKGIGAGALGCTGSGMEDLQRNFYLTAADAAKFATKHEKEHFAPTCFMLFCRWLPFCL